MKNNTIHFKNGTSLVVHPEVIKTIDKLLLSPGGTARFQSFRDEHGNLFLVLNLEDISYID